MNLFSQLICVGCIFSACATPPPHAKEAERVAKNFGLHIQETKHLSSLGSGGFYTNKKVDAFYIDFEIAKEFTESDAKILLKEIVDSFVSYVNQNESVKPYLATYPISPNEVSVSIGFVDKKRAPIQELSQIHLFEGRIYYSKFESDKKTYSPFLEELYIN